MLNEHGLWAFCAGCKRQAITTVLCAFVNYQVAKSIGPAAGYVFGANSDESETEMKTLQAECCRRCGSRELIALMTEIPQPLRDDLAHQSALDRVETPEHLGGPSSKGSRNG